MRRQKEAESIRIFQWANLFGFFLYKCDRRGARQSEIAYEEDCEGVMPCYQDRQRMGPRDEINPDHPR